MAEFTAITSQEQLDSVIGDRLKRQEEKIKASFAGFISPEDAAKQTSDLQRQVDSLTDELSKANKKAVDFEKTLADRDSKIKSFEISATKRRFASEYSLPASAIEFINGDDEESIKQSAESLRALVGSSNIAPAFASEPSGSDPKESYRNIIKNLKK